jgi:hypothetical protein
MNKAKSMRYMVRSEYCPTTKLEQEVILNKSEAYLSLFSRVKTKYIYFLVIIFAFNIFTSLLSSKDKITNLILDVFMLSFYVAGYFYYKSFIGKDLRDYYLKIKKLKFKSPKIHTDGLEMVIKRRSRYADSLRSYEVVYDGKNIGLINNGERKTFNVSPGKHSLYLKIELWRSKEIVFEVDEYANTKFECQNALHGLKILLAPIYMTFLRNHYIELR